MISLGYPLVMVFEAFVINGTIYRCCPSKNNVNQIYSINISLAKQIFIKCYVAFVKLTVYVYLLHNRKP